MQVRRIVSAGIACAILTALVVIPASAHGCHGGRRSGHCGGYAEDQQTAISVCAVADCSLAGRHTHDDVVYCGYDHESGFCNGACLALCPVEDCTVAGRHVHNTVTYCGNDHASGFCDGACSVYSHRSCRTGTK